MTTTAEVQVFVTCTDLDATIAFYTEQLGMRLDMIMPADAPRTAVVSADGVRLRLETHASTATTHAPAISAGHENNLLLSRGLAGDAWMQGRAGMHYRDLIPGRLGGNFIASHIRIADGGPVPDYVHYHKVAFQMIYCRRGWVRVVYEDQGPPFVMRAGDCVLQPPTIRHRVLESSPGLEVIEIGGPAEHETWREHSFDLPTSARHPNRLFAGQRFVHHIAANAGWQTIQESGFEFRDTGIAAATDDIGSARVLRPTGRLGDGEATMVTQIHNGKLLFLYVLAGRLSLHRKNFGTHKLAADDAATIPAGVAYRMTAAAPCEVLEVALPAR
jgi:quercetin dioxygenase-like cupin family protein